MKNNDKNSCAAVLPRDPAQEFLIIRCIRSFQRRIFRLFRYSFRSGEIR